MLDYIVGIIIIGGGWYARYYLDNNQKAPPILKKNKEFIAIFLFAIGMAIIAQTPFSNRQDNVDLHAIVQEWNSANAGMYVDDVRVDSVSLGNHNELIYYITIVDFKSTEVDDDFKEGLKINVIANVLSNPEIIVLLEKFTAVVYRYYGSDSILITEITIDKTSFLKHQENQANNDRLAIVMEIHNILAGTFADDVTRIDSVTLRNQSELVYHSSIIDVKSTDVDDFFIANVRFNVISNARSNPDINNLLEKFTAIVFRYFGSDSIFITEIRITAE